MTIDQIKSELRKIVELSEKATAGPWRVDPYAYPPEQAIVDRDCIIAVAMTVTNEHSRDMEGQRASQKADAAFIARSRTITPQMAKTLLFIIEANEMDDPDAQAFLADIQQAWEESK